MDEVKTESKQTEQKQVEPKPIEVVVPENRVDFEPYDLFCKCTKKEKEAMQEQLEQNTIKFHKGLVEDVLPKWKDLTFTEEGKDGKWLKPRKATMQEKNKLLFVMANRQAKLQAQIDWLKNTQEKYRKLKGE